MSRSKRPAAICPCTNLSIPECSCRRCLEEQIRSFSPLLRRGSLRAVQPGSPQAEVPPEEEHRAA